MPYETFSQQAPVNQTGLTPAYIETIPHNPWDPNVADLTYPDKYSQFVNPTNDQMSAVLVPDEDREVAHIDTGTNNALSLYHVPKDGTTIVVSDGVINTSLTDYQHGVIYFSTMPSGDFTVQYMADPDKYYGEYLQSIQDSIMAMQWLMGAGPTLNEGIKNAEMFLDSLPAEIQARLPHAIHMRAIDRDIEIRSSTDTGSPNGTQHTITIGNGQDTFVANASLVQFHRELGTNPMQIEMGMQTGDLTRMRGQVSAGMDHESRNPGITQSMVTSFEATGTPFVQDTWAHTVYGDQVIMGDQYILGAQITLNVERNVQVNVYEEDLEVGGDTNLGTNTGTKVRVGGDLEVTGGLNVIGAGSKTARFDTPIVFTNGSQKGAFQQGTVDGLDPSYLECVRQYMRSDYKHGYPNLAMPAPLFEGTQSFVTGAEICLDTGLNAYVPDPTTPFPSGRFYTGRFSRGDWWIAITSGDQSGQRRTIKTFDNSTDKWEVTRAFDGALAEGDSFAVYHPEISDYDYIQAGAGLSVTVKANAVWPLVGQQDGIIKKRGSDFQVLNLPSSTTSFIFMSVLPGVNGIDEDEPTFFASTSSQESDKAILIGIVVTAASSVSTISHVLVNGKFDSDWVKIETSGTGNELTAGSAWVLNAGLLNQAKQYHPHYRLFGAPDLSNRPNETNMQPLPLEPNGYYISAISNTTITLATPSGSYMGLSLPYWVRLIVD